MGFWKSDIVQMTMAIIAWPAAVGFLVLGRPLAYFLYVLFDIGWFLRFAATRVQSLFR